MSYRILKDSNNNIWKNTDGKILVDTPIYPAPIQRGLSFWGRAEASLLNLSSGLVTEAYDVRDGYGGIRKMVQGVIANKPTFTSGYIRCDTSKLISSTSVQSPKSMFIVLNQTSSTANSVAGIGYVSGSQVSGWRYLGKGYNANYVHSIGQTGNPYSLFYGNITKATSITVGYKILHTLVDCNISSLTISIGQLYSTGQCDISEWGWYNRVLTEQEVLYNIAALNERYKTY
jgi:hypothetical protein